MHLKLSSAKWRLFRLGLNELNYLCDLSFEKCKHTFYVSWNKLSMARFTVVIKWIIQTLLLQGLNIPAVFVNLHQHLVIFKVLTPLTVWVGIQWLEKKHKKEFNINTLTPGKSEWNFRYICNFKMTFSDGWSISCEIALIWMSLDFTDDQSTLLQVMAWWRQATNHYLSQCRPRSRPPYGVTRPHELIL